MSNLIVPMSPAQKDMFMMERMRPGSTNIAVHVPAADVPTSKVEEVAKVVVSRHDALRAAVDRKSSQTAISSDCEPEVVTADNDADVIEHTQRAILLEDETPNLRVIIDDSSPAERQVRLVAPHAFTDGLSSALLHGEVGRLLHDSASLDAAQSENTGLGYSALADDIFQAYTVSDDQAVDFWEDHLQDAVPLAKELVSADPDPGFVDVALGTDDELRAVQRSTKATEFVFLMSLFAHGVQHMFDMPKVPCRTTFVGRRSKESMEVVGPLAELPLLNVGASDQFMSGSLQAAILQLFTATQPRDPLIKRLSKEAKGATRRACFFRDNRNMFVGDNNAFAADNRHLFEDPMSPTQPAAIGDFEFVSLESAALWGIEHPVRGEVVRRPEDGLTCIRLLTAQVDRKQLLGAAQAIHNKFVDLQT